MNALKLEIASQEETQRLGRLLGSLARPGDVIGLRGDLGAGKTFFAGAVGHGLGVSEDTAVTSPTFTLVNEYLGRLPVYHMDLYRLGDPSELYDLGLWEYYDGEGVCLVEWCDRFDDLWPEHALVVTISLRDGERRGVALAGTGRGEELARELAGKFEAWLSNTSG